MRLFMYFVPAALVVAGACLRKNPPKASVPDRPTWPSAPLGQLPGEFPVFDPYFVESTDTVSPYGPGSITRNMVFDRTGALWLASWEGIIRYDGHTFTNFTKKAGLRRFHVFSVMEDRRGNLWFGTIGAGVYRYDGTSFTNFTKRDGLIDDVVECIVEDQAGNIWFGTAGGASRYDGRTFAAFTTREGLNANSVHAIAEDRAGRMWFGTGGGVCSYDGRGFTEVLRTDGQPFTNVRTIAADRAGRLWIGGQDGLWRYDGQSLTALRPDFTGYLFEDRAGNLWMSAGIPNSSAMAAYRYDGISFTKILDKNARNDHQLFGICQDPAGAIWLGTMKGVCRYDGQTVTYFTKN